MCLSSQHKHFFWTKYFNIFVKKATFAALKPQVYFIRIIHIYLNIGVLFDFQETSLMQIVIILIMSGGKFP